MHMTVEMERAAGPQTLPDPVRQVRTLLCEEFDDVDAALVEGTVVRTYQQLAEDARVVSFLPILTEKVAREQLLSWARGRHRAAAPILSR
jgi:hypothetical protein